MLTNLNTWTTGELTDQLLKNRNNIKVVEIENNSNKLNVRFFIRFDLFIIDNIKKIYFANNSIILIGLVFINQRTLHLYPAVNLNSNNLTKKGRGLSPCLLTHKLMQHL